HCPRSRFGLVFRACAIHWQMANRRDLTSTTCQGAGALRSDTTDTYSRQVRFSLDVVLRVRVPQTDSHSPRHESKMRCVDRSPRPRWCRARASSDSWAIDAVGTALVSRKPSVTLELNFNSEGRAVNEASRPSTPLAFGKGRVTSFRSHRRRD